MKKGIALDMRSPLTVAKYARTDRHVIENIRSRSESPEHNFIECDCGWVGPPPDHPFHRREALEAQRAAAQAAVVGRGGAS